MEVPQKVKNGTTIHSSNCTARYLPKGCKNTDLRDVWVAQSVKCLTLDFSADHGHVVCGIKPHVGLHADSMDPTWDSLSLSLCPSPVLSLKINKHFFKKIVFSANGIGKTGQQHAEG